ncbi:MAG TPA: MMPL family transporter [Gemmatimonadaceae bacterium]
MLPFAHFVVARRWWILAAWLIVGLLVMPSARRVEQRLEVAASVPGSESARVQAILTSRFPAAFPAYAVLVVTGAPSPATPKGRLLLTIIRQRLGSVDVVSRTLSYLDAPDSGFVGRNGETYMVVGLEPRGRRADQIVPLLRAATSSLQSQLRGELPRLEMRWTGELALNYDLRKASSADARDAERRVLPLTAVLLVVAFGAIAAALLPVVVGVIAISLALGAAVLIAGFWPLSLLLQNVVAMLGLGLGIDYALLMVGRFREALSDGLTKIDAARVAAAKAGHTIALSGAAVAIAFSALLIVPVNEIRSIAVGGLLVITIAVLLATSLLPALLAVVGPRINAARVRAPSRPSGSDGWRKWGRFVCAHPLTVLLIAGAPLSLIALQTTRLTSDLPRGDWLPRQMESSLALHTLSTMRTSGIVNALRVVVELPKNSTWDTPAGWSALRRASARIARDPRVARVRSLPVVTGMISPNFEVLAGLPAEARASMATSDGRLALIEVIPSESVGVRGANDLVRDLRALPRGGLTGLSGSAISVGGLPALNVDYETSTLGHFRTIVIVVVGATLLSLLVGFRSALVAIKAVALNLFSVAVAFGAVVLVFQDGHGIRALGLDTALGGTFPAIPLIVFAVVFGLSMDYEVFLVARIAEARAAGSSDDDAIVEGLARTGGLISSAAAIMVAVFAAFTLGDFVLIKILGFALSVAVLVDATVMRLAIGPALLKLGGRWNWWPGKTYPLVRSLPNIQIHTIGGRLDAPTQSVS